MKGTGRQAARFAPMRPLLALIALSGLATAGLARTDPTPERALAGRTPGKPVTCIQQSLIDDSTTYDNGDILYRMRGGTWYLNSPQPKCLGLNSNTGFITRTPSTSLCRGDIAEVVDFAAHIHYGGCALSDFVPYPKPLKAKKPQ